MGVTSHCTAIGLLLRRAPVPYDCFQIILKKDQ